MKPANDITPEDAQAIEQLLIRANALHAEKHLESTHPPRIAPCSRLAPGLSAIQDQARRAVLHREPAQARPPRATLSEQHLAPVDLYLRSPQIRPAAGRRGLDAFEGTCAFASPEGGDAFTPLGEGAENDPTLPGELAYEMTRVPCAVAGTGEMARTALTDNTGNAFPHRRMRRGGAHRGLSSRH